MIDARNLRINAHRLMADVQSLSEIGAETGRGITRRSYSPAYRESLNWLTSRMEGAGLKARIDAVGNVIGRMGAGDKDIVMTGSHVDTVSNGGALDGAYGVVAGLEVARVLRENEIELSRPYEVVAFVEEEGAYLSLFGSRALAGGVRKQQVNEATDAAGRKLRDEMAAAGFNADAYSEAIYPSGSIRKFIELHIEQGPVLENQGLDIGIVDGIVGLKVVDYCFCGLSNHAGTTPMNMRKDALRAAAEFVTEAYAQYGSACSETFRMTFGAVTVEPNQANVIPREVSVRLDCRDLDEANLIRVCRRLSEMAKQVANRYDTSVQIDDLSFDPPALMSLEVIETIKDCAGDLGYSTKVMPSGAGHDAQVLAQVCDSGMIFIPSENGLSHHPQERSSPAQLERGCNVLLQSLIQYLT